PIIATKVGGVPEMVENGINGLLVQPKNSRQLAEKILYLINNPKITQAMAQQTHQKIVKEFGLEKMIQKTKREYRGQPSVKLTS
ncbi:unnamed protein product, partial [marine sediment metagenome]